MNRRRSQSHDEISARVAESISKDRGIFKKSCLEMLAPCARGKGYPRCRHPSWGGKKTEPVLWIVARR